MCTFHTKSEKVSPSSLCLHCTVTDTKQVGCTTCLFKLICAKGWLFQKFLVTEISCQFLSFWGKKYMQGVITTPFRANARFLFRKGNWSAWKGGLNHVLYWNCVYLQSLLLILPRCVERKGKPEHSSVYVYSIESICINKDLKLAN